MQWIRNSFLKGLVTLLPIAITIYILYAGFLIFENWLGSILRHLLPEQAYVPGFGFLLTLVLIFLFGLLLNNIITVSFWAEVEKKLTEVPLIKAVYSPLRDLMNLFSKGQKGLQSVVLVELTPGTKILGLVTRDNFKDIPNLSRELEGKVAVYFPLSYALGGMTLLIDKTKLQIVDIPVEKALSLGITAWVKTDNKESANGNQSAIN